MLTGLSRSDTSKHHQIPARLEIDQATAILRYLRYCSERGEETSYHVSDQQFSSYVSDQQFSLYVSNREIVVQWSHRFVYHGFRLLCFPHGMHRSPSVYQIIDAQTQLLKNFPLNQTTDFPRGPSGCDMFKWVVSSPSILNLLAATDADKIKSHLAFLCHKSKINCHGVGDLGQLASHTNHMEPTAFCVSEWLCQRHAELSLFRFLQSATSHARHNAEDQKEFIYSVFFILMLSCSRKSDASPKPVSEPMTMIT